uniref:Uncharacterized protein n=1 Tax=Ursus americanus TaxID=9643 RepID=A0A452RZ07_URSAM
MAQYQGEKESTMWELPIHKLCLSLFGVRESGNRRTLAAKALGQLIGQTLVFSKARHSIRSFGMKTLNENFAVHCTFHVKAEEILEKVLKVTMRIFYLGIRNSLICRSNMTQALVSTAWDFYVVLCKLGFTLRDKKRRTDCFRDGNMLPGKEIPVSTPKTNKHFSEMGFCLFVCLF